MKILHLIYDHIENPWVAGGGAFRVREIYKRLSGRHEVTVLCGAYPGAEPYTDGNTSYIFKGTQRNNYLLSTFCYAVEAARYVRAHAGEYDIVIEDFAPYNPVFSFLWHRASVIQLHQHEGLRLLKKYALLGVPFFLSEKYYPRFFRHAVTISEMSREKYRLGANCRVIPNGFDDALVNPAAREEDYMLFLGRLHIGQKGLDILSEALGFSSGRLVIAGGGKDEKKVRTLFHKAVEAGRAEFAGFVSGRKKAELLGKCLFMVVPSRYEGQPLSVIEAAACGKPLVVSDIPELKYAVDAGFALPFKSGDARDLADKMNLLIVDRLMRQEMGKRAREYAKDFSWDKISEDFEKFLLGIVS